MENSTKTVLALNSLIEANNKRLEHYSILTKAANHQDLFNLYHKHALQSESFCESLLRWRDCYSGISTREIKLDGLNQAWEQVQSLFRFSRRSDLIQSERIENDTLKVYRTVIELPFLPSETLTEIRSQIREIELALREIKEFDIIRGHAQPSQTAVA